MTALAIHRSFDEQLRGNEMLPLYEFEADQHRWALLLEADRRRLARLAAAGGASDGGGRLRRPRAALGQALVGLGKAILPPEERRRGVRRSA